MGENSVEFNDAYYTQDTYMIFKLGAPVDGIFVIYLNDEEAGYYGPADHDIHWNDEFVDQWDDKGYARFLKRGDYDVYITLRDSSGVETLFDNSQFSILSMNADTEDKSYYEGDDVTITFDGDYDTSMASKLEVVLIKSWSPMGPDEEVIAKFGSDDIAKMYDSEEKSFSFVLGSLPVGKNMIMLHYMVADDELELYKDHYIQHASDAINVNVLERIDPNLTISVDDILEGNPTVVKITTNATFSGNVVVKIGNKEYNVTVVNGTGTLNVPNLAAGPYTATAIFAATGIFIYSEKTASFTVAKKPVTPAKKTKIKLTLKKVKVKKSAKKLVLRATLKINGKAVKGKKITFKFKGKKYKAKTNKKGVAKVTIKKKVLKKLKVGKKVKYQATYGKVTKKYTVKVKK